MLLFFYFLFYFLPSVVLALLQISHIKKAMTQDAVILSPDEYIKAGKYSISKLKISILEQFIGIAIFGFWVFFGLEFLQSLVGINGVLSNLAFLFVFFAVGYLVSLPIDAYIALVLDKKFGFSNQNIGLFLLDGIKSVFMFIAFGGLIVYLLLMVVEHVSLWWFWGFVVLFCIVVLTNLIYPTIIAPIFNKFTPLLDSELLAKIESILQKVGFKSSGVFIMDASKRDGRLNAYFGGIGKSKRVVLFDTLLDKISTDGLIAILGHELGHFKNKDLLKNMVIVGIFLFVSFFVVGHLPNAVFEQMSIQKNSSSLLAVLVLFSPIISFWFLPIIGFFSRRAEFGADRFGATLTSNTALAEALVRLVNENRSFPSSHKAYIFFYYTHPPLLLRLKALKYEI